LVTCLRGYKPALSSALLATGEPALVERQ
jgi:hypothetical protein